MYTYDTAIHPELTTLVNLAPTLTKLINSEITLVISDNEKIICQIIASELDFGDITNKSLTEQDPMVSVIRTRKVQIMNVPKEIYGVPFRGAIAPIFSHTGEVIGSISINTTLSNQTNLIEVAEQLTMSSEEMSASTNELSNTANELMKYMENLSNAQTEMFKQVENSTKILEMINTVAKHTRILGLNAGIEAARSGVHGKGFSVVAREITKLADLSAGSVEEIRQLMNLLKLKVEQVEEIVNETTSISNQQFDSINEISNAMYHLTFVAEKVEGLAKKI